MTEAKLLEGKAIAERIKEGLKKEISAIKSKFGRPPKLVSIKIGSNQSTEMYIRAQKKTAECLGVDYQVADFPEATKEAELIDRIGDLNKDEGVDGILVNLPLPKHLDINKINAAINPKKDVEGVHTDNLGLVVLKKAKLAPCTALACMELIESTGVDLYGAECVVVGSSKIVGRPITLLLLEKMATTTVCHIGTSEKGMLEKHVKDADILIVAVGKAHLIPGSWVKKGAIVIDIGVNEKEGKTVGDVEFEKAVKRASYITPVPGGVGPLTVTMLMRNLVTAFKWQRNMM